MKKKYNFKIDYSNQEVLIEVSTRIFPVSVILNAAYYFIDDFKVIAQDEKRGKISIVFIPEKDSKRDLEELAYEFNIQLISSFVEDKESAKHAGVRETLLKAALLPVASNPNSQKENIPKS